MQMKVMNEDDDDDVRSQIVSDAIIDGCQFDPSSISVTAVGFMTEMTHKKLNGDEDAESVPAITGSAAEFYIQPMMPHVGDFDIMYYYNTQLAIPAGHRTPSRLPAEIGKEVTVHEIRDTSLPCYVYLRRKYRLSRDADNNICISNMYSGLECLSNRVHNDNVTVRGPADSHYNVLMGVSNVQWYTPLVPQAQDSVRCIHCPVWPPQATGWTRRDRYHGWPDSVTTDRVVSQGCDVVPVSHRSCRDDDYQWRLSFSRAEVILLNSWTPIQQIVYHLLRFFMKTEHFTADDSPLSNYHTKTLMLWSCELRPANWWPDSNLIQLCCELLHELARSLNDEMCRHYFVVDCNLFDVVTSRDPVVQSIIANLQSCTQSTLTTWFIEHYLQTWARRHSDDVGRMFDDVITTSQLQTAVRVTLHWKDYHAARMAFHNLHTSALDVIDIVNQHPLTVRMCTFYHDGLSRADPRLLDVFFAAVLMKCSAEIEVRGCLNVDTIDALWTVVTDTKRRFADVQMTKSYNAEILSRITDVIRRVSANTCSDSRLLREVAKIIIHRYLAVCTDDYVYCMCCFHLACLYHITGHHQLTMDYCNATTLISTAKVVLLGSVSGQLLVHGHVNEVSVTSGLVALYQYIGESRRTSTRPSIMENEYTPTVLIHFLLIHSQSKPMHMPSHTLREFKRKLVLAKKLFVADLCLLRLTGYHCISNEWARAIDSRRFSQELFEYCNWSDLQSILLPSAGRHFASFLQLEAQEFNGDKDIAVATNDFEALYAYRCGQYDKCLTLSQQIVDKTLSVRNKPHVYIRGMMSVLMDSDIRSVLGLMELCGIETYSQTSSVGQDVLALNLVLKCKLKCNHSTESLTETLCQIKTLYQRYDNRTEPLSRCLLAFMYRSALLH